ncbi:MAG: Smr/MutS family protein, partial [Dehalococcoidia bacterium]|nr:Smr/MutS family protein [Dehalococcoidia bacterium]
RIEQDRARIMEDARNEVLREADDLLRALQRAMATAQQQGATPSAAALAHAAAEVARERQAVARRARDRQRAAPRARPLRVGDPVKIRAFGSIGELLRIDAEKNEAEVSLGQMRARVSLADIEPVSTQIAARERQRTQEDTRPRFTVSRPEVAAELDIRGRRVDEVPETLERYLNDAYLSNRPSVRIIHGKGTGALRQVVRQFMAASPLVREWQPAEPNQGGEGATVATLAL